MGIAISRLARMLAGFPSAAEGLYLREAPKISERTSEGLGWILLGKYQLTYGFAIA
jgi:hypothetical protein